MLPIYKATEIIKRAVEGGTTLPCLMSVIGEDTGGDRKECIVKVFGQNHLEQYNPTKKEILANVLAQEFELPVPVAVLVRVGKNLIAELNKDESYKKVALRAGVYYGCEFIPNCLPFTKDLKTSFFDRDIMEQVFAFDVLIRNFDRRLNKPNILLQNKEVYLIDHDLTLDINRSYQSYKTTGNGYRDVIDGAKGRHIFLDHLKKLHKNNNFTFDWFIENLRLLNLHNLQSCNNQLEELSPSALFNDNEDDFQPIIDYLKEIKSTPSNFQNLLKELLTDE
jgi:hypothetical protein